MQKIIPIPHEDFLGQELKEGDKVAFIVGGASPKLCQGIVIGFSKKTININECNSKGKPFRHWNNTSPIITYVPPKKVAKI